MAVVKRNRQLIAFVILAVAMFVGLGAMIQDHENELRAEQQRTADQLYRAALASCERGNTIREVVYANTLLIRDDSRFNYDDIREQLKTLRAAPYVDLRDGTVDCEQAVRRPRPEDS